MVARTQMTAAFRVVLDTNVILSALLFKSSLLKKDAFTLAGLVTPSSAVSRVALAALVVLGGSLTFSLAQQPSEAKAEAINRKYGKGKNIMTLVPAAQALVALRTRIAEKRLPGLNSQGELFVDAVHPSPPLEALNIYLHYAVLYGKSPVGLPMAAPMKAAKLEAWDDALSRALQEIAWQTATHIPYSGITTSGAK